MRAELRDPAGRSPDPRHVNFQPIVAWRHRAEFPMLTHISPVGDTVYNSMQVNTLIEELETIKTMIERQGTLRTVEALGSRDIFQDARLFGWDLESGLPDMVDDLIEMCWATREPGHKSLWFLGL